MYLLATRETSAAVTFSMPDLVFLEEIGGVAVEGEDNLLVEGFVGRVVVEDEGVEELVFCFGELGGGGRVRLEAVDLLEHGLCGGYR